MTLTCVLCMHTKCWAVNRRFEDIIFYVIITLRYKLPEKDGNFMHWPGFVLTILYSPYRSSYFDIRHFERTRADSGDMPGFEYRQRSGHSATAATHNSHPSSPRHAFLPSNTGAAATGHRQARPQNTNTYADFIITAVVMLHNMMPPPPIWHAIFPTVILYLMLIVSYWD